MYYEVRDSDFRVSNRHDDIFNHWYELVAVWADQKRNPNLGHPINEVELGLLIQFDLGKPKTTNVETPGKIKEAKSLKSKLASRRKK